MISNVLGFTDTKTSVLPAEISSPECRPCVTIAEVDKPSVSGTHADAGHWGLFKYKSSIKPKEGLRRITGGRGLLPVTSAVLLL